MSQKYESCSDCTAGYCAPNRCYCGHEACNAYSSYVPRKALSAAAIQAVADAHMASKHAEAWANRGDNSWLEKM